MCPQCVASSNFWTFMCWVLVTCRVARTSQCNIVDYKEIIDTKPSIPILSHNPQETSKTSLILWEHILSNQEN